MTPLRTHPMHTSGRIISKGLYVSLYIYIYIYIYIPLWMHLPPNTGSSVALSVQRCAGAQEIKAHPTSLWRASRCCRRMLRTAAEMGKESSRLFMDGFVALLDLCLQRSSPAEQTLTPFAVFISTLSFYQPLFRHLSVSRSVNE